MIWIWDENINALRPSIAEECVAEIAETHGMDPAGFSKQFPGAKMEQKKIEHARRVEGRASIEAKRVKQLLYTLDSQPPKPLSARLQEQLMGSDGLRHFAAAMTILATDYGGTTPLGTCEVIAEVAPSFYRAWGLRRVLAACEEIQHAEIPDQSRLYQRMFQKFNMQYFADRLPDYKIRVVVDVWYWGTERCGCTLLPAGRQIFIRFRLFSSRRRRPFT